MELSFSLKVAATSSQVWEYYEKIENWKVWEIDLEHISLEGAFITGTKGSMTLKGMPSMAITLTSVVKNKEFVDVTETPVGTVTFSHYIQELSEGVIIRHSVKMDQDNQELLPMLSGIFSDVPETMCLLKKVVESNGV